MRQKIFFFTSSLHGGGVERVFLTLLRHLDRTQFEPHLVVLQATGEFLDDVPHDVVLHDLRAPRLRYGLPKLLRLVWRHRPVAVLSTTVYTNVALVLLRPFLPPGTRLLLREPSVVRHFLREETRHPRLWEWLYRHLYKRADRVVCSSEWLVDYLVEHFNLPREKLVQIYNPADIKRVQEWAEIGENPNSGAGPHLVAVGWLQRSKGFDVLLEAMPAVLERLPHARLTIVGDGPLRDDLTEQARRLGLTETVRFPGFQRNPWPYFKHANLFVHPSRHECFGNVLLEALALGTPVVATDCPGGIREIQACDKRMLLVPTEDPRALAEAIILVCTQSDTDGEKLDPKKNLIQFDLERVVGEYSTLFSG